MYIAAVIPPNNAEIPLLAVKRNLFRYSSALSAWALKPMIPFAFFEKTTENVSRKDLPELPVGGLVVDLPSVMDKQYVIGSAQCSEFCVRLEALFTGCEGFRSGLHGLHLFDTRDDDINDMKTLKQTVYSALSGLEQSVFVWQSCSLGVFRGETELFSTEKWWTKVILSEEYEIRFPKNRKQ